MSPEINSRHCFHIHIANGVFAIRDRSSHSICSIIQISVCDKSFIVNVTCNEKNDQIRHRDVFESLPSCDVFHFIQAICDRRATKIKNKLFSRIYVQNFSIFCWNPREKNTHISLRDPGTFGTAPEIEFPILLKPNLNVGNKISENKKKIKNMRKTTKTYDLYCGRDSTNTPDKSNALHKMNNGDAIFATPN